MRSSISAQSCASVPPAPGWIVTMALPGSCSPPSMRCSSSRCSASSISLQLAAASAARVRVAFGGQLEVDLASSSSLRCLRQAISGALSVERSLQQAPAPSARRSRSRARPPGIELGDARSRPATSKIPPEGFEPLLRRRRRVPSAHSARSFIGTSRRLRICTAAACAHLSRAARRGRSTLPDRASNQRCLANMRRASTGERSWS